MSSKKGGGPDNDGLGKGFSDATLSFGLAHAGERGALGDGGNLDGPATLVREYSERAVGEARRELTWIKRGTLASRQALAMAMALCTLTLRMVKLLGAWQNASTIQRPQPRDYRVRRSWAIRLITTSEYLTHSRIER